MFYNPKMTEVTNPHLEAREPKGLCAEGTWGLCSLSESRMLGISLTRQLESSPQKMLLCPCVVTCGTGRMEAPLLLHTHRVLLLSVKTI